jgi:hypothetical protein
VNQKDHGFDRFSPRVFEWRFAFFSESPWLSKCEKLANLIRNLPGGLKRPSLGGNGWHVVWWTGLIADRIFRLLAALQVLVRAPGAQPLMSDSSAACPTAAASPTAITWP